MAIAQLIVLLLLPLPHLLLLGKAAGQQPYAEEAQALLQFKQGLVGADDLLAHWLPSNVASLCSSWEGVICSPSSSSSGAMVVTGLNFTNWNLNGTLTPPLCDLPHLTHLYLRYNLFAQPFPAFLLRSCPLLVVLDLSQNWFSGPLPSNISALSRLQFLSLEANSFVGPVPSDFGKLPSLTLLRLRGNALSGPIPPQLGNLSSLQTLDLAYASFDAGPLPAELGNLTSLRELVLENCSLTGPIPSSLGNLRQLYMLDLANNALSGPIPSSLTNLTNLTRLYLWTNRLSGPIPPSIANLSKVLELDLGNNSLEGSLPEGLSGLLSVQLLNLEDNRFTGGVPPGIALLPELNTFLAYNNQLNGTISSSYWGKNAKLEQFDLSYNSLTGPVPPNLCYGNTLVYFSLAGNMLDGQIPESYGNCSSVKRFLVDNNKLSGRVPDGLWALPSLEVLMLQHNSLSGNILAEIIFPRKSASMQLLYIDFNQFAGPLPSSISYYWNLTKLSASHNKLSGPLPSELGRLLHLSTLDLSSNILTGQIPSSVGDCEHLVSLNLAHNNFTGAIPSQLSSIPVLNYLDLSYNELKGSIPSSFGDVNFVVLNVAHNNLSGSVPASLAKAFPFSNFDGNPSLCVSGPCVENVGSPHAGTKYDSKLLLVLIIILPCAAVLLLLLLVRTLYLRKKYVPEVDQMTDWDVVPFEKLGFDKENLLENLDEENAIGSGASGTVYKVMVTGGIPVAVKKLLCTKERLQRGCSLKEIAWKAEIDILGRIKHTNIVRLLCSCARNDCRLLVYEFMPNGSLGDLLHKSEKNLLDWPKRFEIALGAAHALSYLHHDCVPSVLHRDIKSNNILIDSDFQAKLADFGVAKAVAGEPGNMTAIIGSVGYIAPEYAYTLKVDEKSDVYSYGVVLLELLTGRSPTDEQFSEGGGPNMVRWVGREVQARECMWGVFDHRVTLHCCSNGLSGCRGAGCSWRESMVSMLKVALLCTSVLPQRRPSMREVVEMLLRSMPFSVEQHHHHRRQNKVQPHPVHHYQNELKHPSPDRNQDSSAITVLLQ